MAEDATGTEQPLLSAFNGTKRKINIPCLNGMTRTFNWFNKLFH